MINLENEKMPSRKWWKQYRKDIEKAKKSRYGKLNWTPWGHVDQLKKNPDFVRKLYKHGKVTADFLKELGIKG